MTISFETSDRDVARAAPGASRGVALAVAAASLALAAAVLAPLLHILLSARGELGALSVDPVRALSALELRKFPFQEAAAASGRVALAQAFLEQTRLSILGLCAIAIYFAWRGYANPRPRGWGHHFWVSALCLFFFAPAVLPRLSAPRVDYAATAVFGAAHGLPRPAAALRPLRAAVLPLKLDPVVVLAIRAGLAALAAAFLALACHDAAYRLREALIEFGLMEAESQVPGSSGAAEETAEAIKIRRARRKASEEPRPEEEGSRFGPQGRSRRALAQDDPRTRAFAVLGLPVGASRAEIEKAFRAKIKRAHPDHGGSVEQAAALNQARDLLLPQG